MGELGDQRGRETAPSKTRLCLGVAELFSGRRWTMRLDPAGAERALAIAQTQGVPELLARVLAARDVAAAAVPAFLEPRLRDLMPDPYRLTDMAAAVDRLAWAVEKRELVAIFGDYDVDGACSAALLAGFLGQTGVPHRIHIPDRITEGYGPTIEAVRALAAAGARLLVTVDCGTASHEPIEEARRLGLDTLVLDHHQAPELLPAARALVNPNREDDLSGLGHLAAAGIVFMTLVALARELRARRFFAADRPEPDLMAAVDLVALATVADVVPLVGLNRAFVRRGLEVMRKRERPGLRALLDVARLDQPPTTYHLGFLIGPRINAGGRIGDAALGARLLLTADPAEAVRIAAELDPLNRERQIIEQAALVEAEAMAQQALAAAPERAVLAVGSPEWHPGIVGLVAARLKERHRRPAFAFAWGGEGRGTGSGRSIQGVDLGRAVRAAVDSGLAVKGGGHRMAAGLTVEQAGLEALVAFLERSLADDVAVARAEEGLAIDAPLTARGVSTEVAALVEKAGPFGSGNPEPVFVLAEHHLVDAVMVGSGHLRLKLRAGDGATAGAIAFRAAESPLGKGLLAARGERVHVAGALSIDRWGGNERAELRVLDAAAPSR